MKIDHLDGKRRPGLDLAQLRPPLAAALARLPGSYREFLSLCDGIALQSGALLYGSGELAKRNETYEVEAYLPGHVAIGDDGGELRVRLATARSGDARRHRRADREG